MEGNRTGANGKPSLGLSIGVFIVVAALISWAGADRWGQVLNSSIFEL